MSSTPQQYKNVVDLHCREVSLASLWFSHNQTVMFVLVNTNQRTVSRSPIRKDFNNIISVKDAHRSFTPLSSARRSFTSTWICFWIAINHSKPHHNILSSWPYEFNQCEAVSVIDSRLPTLKQRNSCSTCHYPVPRRLLQYVDIFTRFIRTRGMFHSMARCAAGLLTSRVRRQRTRSPALGS